MKKVTKGDWKVAMNGAQVWCNNTDTICTMNMLLDNAAHNASLIAEAGTVYNETGMSPRDLLGRIKELERQISARDNEQEQGDNF